MVPEIPPFRAYVNWQSWALEKSRSSRSGGHHKYPTVLNDNLYRKFIMVHAVIWNFHAAGWREHGQNDASKCHSQQLGSGIYLLLECAINKITGKWPEFQFPDFHWCHLPVWESGSRHCTIALIGARSTSGFDNMALTVVIFHIVGSA